MSESKSFFGDHDEMAHIWARIQAFDQVSRFVLFEPAASTMQKINPVGCFNLSLKVCLYTFISCIFEENHQNRILKSGEKNYPTISLFSRN